jgi:hypothetical protein
MNLENPDTPSSSEPPPRPELPPEAPSTSAPEIPSTPATSGDADQMLNREQPLEPTPATPQDTGSAARPEHEVEKPEPQGEQSKQDLVEPTEQETKKLPNQEHPPPNDSQAEATQAPDDDATAQATASPPTADDHLTEKDSDNQASHKEAQPESIQAATKIEQPTADSTPRIDVEQLLEGEQSLNPEQSAVESTPRDQPTATATETAQLDDSSEPKAPQQPEEPDPHHLSGSIGDSFETSDHSGRPDGETSGDRPDQPHDTEQPESGGYADQPDANQSRDGGSGDPPNTEDRSGTSTGDDPFDNMTPAEQQRLLDAVIEDSNPRFRTTPQNAEAMLRGGPPGTTPHAVGPGGLGGDVQFVDSNGDVVMRREAKNMTGDSFNTFKSHLKDGLEQINNNGEVWFQVPPGTNADALVQRWQGQRTDAALARYDDARLIIRDQTGHEIGRYNLGERMP